MNRDIILYKELVAFCNANQNIIETKFKRNVQFDQLNEDCFIEMYCKQRKTNAPLAPKIIKERVQGLKECYKELGRKFFRKRNKSIKGLDIQLGQWYEKAFQLFLQTKGIHAQKKGSPYPDFVINPENPKAYFEIKYIEAPFISAHNLVKITYPYDSKRYDYECSLTLDTGKKMQRQRIKYEEEIKKEGIPFFYVWWFDAPHLKGIFYMPAQDVHDYYDKVGDLHERKEREGDKIAPQEKKRSILHF